LPAKTSARSSKSLYDVHPGIAAVQDWVSGLKTKTGRSLDEWLREIRKNGPRDLKALREWLKTKHMLGTNSTWWLADRADGKGTDDEDPAEYLNAAAGFVDKMYAGPKSALRPIHDALMKLGRSLARDVRICPCQTIVPFYRNHVIAQIKPTTRTRIDFGLALAKHKGKLPARLIDTGGLAKKDRITHRFELTSKNEIDAEVKKCLKIAYELDGK